MGSQAPGGLVPFCSLPPGAGASGRAAAGVPGWCGVGPGSGLSEVWTVARLGPGPWALRFLLSCSPALPWEREGREAAKPPALAGAQVDVSSPLPPAGVWGPEGPEVPDA